MPGIPSAFDYPDPIVGSGGARHPSPRDRLRRLGERAAHGARLRRPGDRSVAGAHPGAAAPDGAPVLRASTSACTPTTCGWCTRACGTASSRAPPRQLGFHRRVRQDRHRRDRSARPRRNNAWLAGFLGAGRTASLAFCLRGLQRCPTARYGAAASPGRSCKRLPADAVRADSKLSEGVPVNPVAASCGTGDSMTMLDVIRRVDWWLVFVATTPCVLIGLVFIHSATRYDPDFAGQHLRQALFMGVSAGHRWTARGDPVSYVRDPALCPGSRSTVLVVVALLLLPVFGTTINGARRWFLLPGFADAAERVRQALRRSWRWRAWLRFRDRGFPRLDNLVVPTLHHRGARRVGDEATGPRAARWCSGR